MAIEPISGTQEIGNPARAGEWSRNWPVLVASAGGVALSTTHIYSLGVFMVPLEAEFGWSRAQISSGLTIGSIVALFCSPFFGLLVDRIGPRRIALCGAIVYCIMVALLSQAGPSIWSWYLIWVGLAIGINGITPTIWTSAVSGLFERGRGLALSVTLCGTGLGSSLTPLVSAWLNAAYGWRVAYVGLAVFWATLILPALFLCFTSVTDQLRRAAPAAPLALKSLTGLTARSAYRSARFYKLAIAACAIALVAVSFAVNLVPILASTGIDRARSVEIASVVGIASIIGRLTGGFLIDRVNGNLVAAVSVLLPVVSSVLLLAMPGVTSTSIVAAILLGLSLGAELDAVAYLATRHLGMRNFGVLFGTISGLLSLCTGLGPLLVSYTFDVTRSYDIALLAYTPLCMLAAVLFLSLGRYPDFADTAEGANDPAVAWIADLTPRMRRNGLTEFR